MSHHKCIAIVLPALMLSLLISSISIAAGVLITDFTSPDNDLKWYSQNDNVMGGRSTGGFEIEVDHLYFTGNTNTNGGGFSSIRSAPLNLDFSNYQGIELDVTGDGRRYNWSLKTDATLRGRPISYWAGFMTEAGKRLTVKIPFEEFYPRFRGTILQGPVLEKHFISELGLYIYDDNDGPFSLRLYSVAVY